MNSIYANEKLTPCLTRRVEAVETGRTHVGKQYANKEVNSGVSPGTGCGKLHARPPLAWRTETYTHPVPVSTAVETGCTYVGPRDPRGSS